MSFVYQLWAGFFTKDEVATQYIPSITCTWCGIWLYVGDPRSDAHIIDCHASNCVNIDYQTDHTQDNCEHYANTWYYLHHGHAALKRTGEQ